ncbi:hypothetical protein LCGC14_1383120 [marine sediment metagenome]|uniref:N-sulphoglucosamine sulphohydrolase C-terminal domain-containing protein n=2 Tax=root TaxID=1 RepID=A0A831QQ14_9FLAO|nr:hypothetical protein [Pricia sp.]HEA20922.1 hypothetical protein [Pricia antarctica]
MTEKPLYQDLTYRKGIPSMKEILQMEENNNITNPYLADWFKTPKPTEELYHVENDPDEVQNLANDPRYASKLKELRKVFQN